MQCPNCNTKFNTGNKCPQCNVDIVIYTGISRLSNRLYNQGLEKLKNADLTYGIESLRKSISVNKNNIPARNLLGLALLEVGHVGEALKHWIISTSLLKEENPAQGYIDKVNKSSRNLEKLNDATNMYNTALGHIKQKSDDLAIIQLKKAVETNPRFIDAINLLTLCYLIQSDKDRAATCVEKVLMLDVQNPTALNYYNVLYPGKPRGKVRAAAPPRKQPVAASNPVSYQSMSMQEKKSTNFHIAEILSFIIGVVSAAAIVYFLLIPAFERDHEAEIGRVRQEITEAQTVHEENINEVTAAMEVLEQQISDLNNVITTRDAGIERQDRIIRVHQAYWHFSNDQMQEAVDIIDILERTDDLPFDIERRIEDIREGAYPVLGLSHYNTGLAAFNANPRDTYLARVNLELAFRFMDAYANQYNELLFMLGTLNYDDERFEEAEALLYALRERAPNHRPQMTTNMLNSIADQED